MSTADGIRDTYRSGHLVYVSGGVLYARTFDPSRMVVGNAVSVVEGVLRGIGSGAALGWYAVSDEGTLVTSTRTGGDRGEP